MHYGSDSFWWIWPSSKGHRPPLKTCLQSATGLLPASHIYSFDNLIATGAGIIHIAESLGINVQIAVEYC